MDLLLPSRMNAASRLPPPSEPARKPLASISPFCKWFATHQNISLVVLNYPHEFSKPVASGSGWSNIGSEWSYMGAFTRIQLILFPLSYLVC